MKFKRIFNTSEMIAALYDSEMRSTNWFFSLKNEDGDFLDEPILVQIGKDCDGTSGYSIWRADDVANRLGFTHGEFASSYATTTYLDGSINNLSLIAWGEKELP